MKLREIPQKMKESKIVRAYIYLLIVIIIVFGIGCFIYLNSQLGNSRLSSSLNAALISIFAVLIILIGFFFRAKFLLLRAFIEGHEAGIKFQIGIIIICLILISIFYKFFIEKMGILLFSFTPFFAILILIFDFLRLKELKKK